MLHINVQQLKKVYKKLTGKSYKDFPVVREMGLVADVPMAHHKEATSCLTGGSNIPPGCCDSIIRVPLPFYQIKKRGLRLSFLFGARDGTRTHTA